MSHLDLTRHRTRSPSPSQIFGSSTTPVATNSTHSEPSASSILRSILGEYADPKRPDVSGADPIRCPVKRVHKTPAVRASSPGRENVPVRTLQSSKDAEGDNFSGDGQLTPCGGPRPLAERLSPKLLAKQTRRKGVGAQKRTKGCDLVDRILTGRSIKASATAASKSSDLPQPQRKGIPTLVKEANPGEADWEDEGLQLEPATKRKYSWTPVKDTNLSIIDLTANSGSSPPSIPGREAQKFTSLVSRYGFAETSPLAMKNEFPEDFPTRKRQLDLLQGTTNSSSSEGSSNKSSGKCPLKVNGTKGRRSRKVTTITSLSTAQYGLKDSPVESFPSVDTTERPSGKRSKSQTKKGGNKKPAGVSDFKVAPTTDALKSLEDQVYLFGTSSQLERVSSDEDKLGVPLAPASSRQSARDRTSVSTLSKYKVSRNLWAAGWRDLDGSVADIEIVDMVNIDTPKSHESSTLTLPSTSTNASNQGFSSQNTINDRSKPSQTTSTTTESTGVESGQLVVPSLCEDLSEKAGYPAVPERETLSSREIASSESAYIETMPSFRGFTTAELAQKVAAFGFKPIKSREKMISLLEKCWQSQHKNSAPTSLPANNANPPDSHASGQKNVVRCDTGGSNASHTTKRASKAPQKKQSTSSTSHSAKAGPKQVDCSQERPNHAYLPHDSTQASSQPVIVIPDSEESGDDFQDTYLGSLNRTSSTNYHPLSANSIPDGSPLFLRTISQASTEEKTSDPSDINQQITRAIKAQPRMTAINGMKRPTWLEKILMYDPIWLEDLTVWLNTEGLDRVGEDREVSRLTVREWCESKGICCTWKKPT
ncbi:hypothetical protein CIRG_04372 [Coccidioides immitis RMSCC 2394]|uniref:Structure-specific endonuclease subunit SLX4 n=1 Tax=Coccidioides immitis RMSCC 2394 TaxID=404692 RepID=A0A0J6Y7N8_COCIT|nr:hypothetical protein CIRG_04372 [Coccidioides immitis RMSCC 2394]